MNTITYLFCINYSDTLGSQYLRKVTTKVLSNAQCQLVYSSVTLIDICSSGINNNIDYVGTCEVI